MQCGKKQRTGLLHRHPFERRSSSIKARRRQSRSTGFARDFGWIVAGTKPSGRTLDLYIYIYIANGESPSQHVTVGLAEARPNYINRASDRLALCPRRSKPKSRANPVLRHWLPLTLNGNDFLSKGCLRESLVFCFFTHCIGCSAAL